MLRDLSAAAAMVTTSLEDLLHHIQEGCRGQKQSQLEEAYETILTIATNLQRSAHDE